MHIITLLLILFLQVSPLQHRVSREPTPMNKIELAGALDNGHTIVFGCSPSPERLAVAWSHVAIENRQGLTIYNHNLGNINSTGGGPYYVLRNRFRAYPSRDLGAVGYWSTIRDMCSGVLAHFDAGDPYGAGHTLGRCGYHRTDFHVYSKAMKDLYGTGMRAVRESRSKD